MAEVKSSELDVLSKLYKPCKTLAMSAELFFSSVLEGLALGSVSFFTEFHSDNIFAAYRGREVISTDLRMRDPCGSGDEIESTLILRQFCIFYFLVLFINLRKLMHLFIP